MGEGARRRPETVADLLGFLNGDKVGDGISVLGRGDGRGLVEPGKSGTED